VFVDKGLRYWNDAVMLDFVKRGCGNLWVSVHDMDTKLSISCTLRKGLLVWRTLRWLVAYGSWDLGACEIILW
jgi:hypothetical protein